MSNEILIYKHAQQQVKIRLNAGIETLWLTQALIAELFEVKPQNITMHIKSIYANGDLKESATCKEFLQIQKEGKLQVIQQRFYSNAQELQQAFIVLIQNMPWSGVKICLSIKSMTRLLV